MTAAVIMLALESVGHDDNALYDARGAEGSRQDTPHRDRFARKRSKLDHGKAPSSLKAHASASR